MRAWALVLWVGCAGAAPPEAARVSEAGRAPERLAAAAVAQAEADAAPTPGARAAAVGPAVRQIVRRATLSVTVEDVGDGVAHVLAVVSEHGGFVASSEVVPEGSFPSADLTLRIPEEHLDAAMDAIAAGALKVSRRALTSEDVTATMVDVQAALNNQRALEARLRDYLAVADGIDDILRVEGELTRVRQSVDATEGRLKGLQGQIAMATLEVSLNTGGVVSRVAAWSPFEEAEAALEGLLDGGRALATVAIWGVLCVAPLLAVALLPFWLLRRWRGRA